MSNLPTFAPPAAPRRPALILIILLAVFGVGLIGAGSVALAWSLINQRANSIPQLLGADTQIYAAITPNLRDLPNIERLRRAFPEAVDYETDPATGDQLRELLGVEMQQDVMPWLGAEVAFAASGLPVADLAVIGAEFENLNDLEGARLSFILASRDRDAALAFLAKQRAHREAQGEQFVEQQIEAVTIVASQSAERSPISAFALVGEYVVFASDADTIAAIVARDSDGPDTLQASSRFQALQAVLPEDRMGYVYLDGVLLRDLVEAGGAQAATSLGEQPQGLNDTLAVANAVHGLGFVIAAVDVGLRFDAVAAIDVAALPANLQASLAEMRLPVSAERSGAVGAAAIGTLSFRIPPSFADQIQAAIAEVPAAAEQVAEYEQMLGLNLEQDLLNWFHGEAVLTVTAETGEVPVGGYFALAPDDPQAAQSGVGRIITALEELAGGDLGLSEATYGNGSYQVLELPEGVGGYGFVGNDLVIGFGANALAAASGSGANLSEQRAYQAAVGGLPSPNGGVLFIDLPAVRTLARDLDELDAEVEARLEPFRAIAAAATPGISDSGTTRATLLVLIGE
ncbi:MAG: DUF3352 domain-containing protein [Oscillochloris sp.]|nr:DUF3352 domain-containing protein [Oscillochloris sp.]